MPNGDADVRPTSALALATCALLAISEGFYLPITGLVGPSLMHEMALNQSQFGLSVTLMMVGFFFGSSFGGAVGDRYGRSLAIAASFALVGIASAWGAVVQDFGALIAVRILCGLGLGAGFPNIMALAIAQAPAHLRARAITAVTVGAGTGGISAGLLMGIGGAAITWRLSFWVAGALAVVFLPLLVVVSRRNRQAAGSSEAKSPNSRAILTGEGRLTVSLLLWTASFFSAINFQGIGTWGPALLDEQGLSARVIGAGAALAGVCSMFGGFFYATLLDRGWRRAALFISFLGSIPAVALFLFASTTLSGIGAFVAIGLTLLGAQTVLFAMAGMSYPPEGQATGIGATVAAGRLGSIIAPVALGAILEAGGGHGRLMAVMIPVTFVSLACLLVAARRGPAGRASSTPIRSID